MTDLYKLLRDIPEADLRAGSLGRIIDERGGDDRQYVVAFDCRPGLGVVFTDPQFDPRSPEYALEAVDPRPRRARVINHSAFEPPEVVDEPYRDPDED
jgi:hypothetical protein